jgi:type IV pilus assembly protein PilA
VRHQQAQGFALIDLIFVCGIIGLLASIAVPRMVLAKQAAGAASAIGSIRSISSAELTYALTCGNGFYAANLTTLGIPPAGSQEPFIGGGLGAADIVGKSGYQFQVHGTAFAAAPPTCNGLTAGESAQGFFAIRRTHRRASVALTSVIIRVHVDQDDGRAAEEGAQDDCGHRP